MSRVFGPVPSRRLGFSLGVDLVPFKTCSLDCVYCQLGSAGKPVIRRGEYVPVGEVLEELEAKLKAGGRIDWITLSGSGEPTLHSGIGRLIPRIKEITRIPVAVLTNGTLLGLPGVREELAAADLVVPSLDAGTEEVFARINRPHRALSLEGLTSGIAALASGFPGRVWLEVMLLSGLNDSEAELEAIAGRIRRIRPDRVQLNTAVRPPAESGVTALSPGELERARHFLESRIDRVPVEIVAGFSGKRERANDRDLPGEIAGYLERRPATAADLSAVFGLDRREALRHLDQLKETGTIRETLSGGEKFFTAAPE